MGATQFQRLEAVFEQAMSLPPGEREAHVHAACSDDAALAARVLAMVAAAEDQTDPLQATVAGAVEQAQSPLLGRRIGPYRIVAELGSGGMGTVYEAVRADADFEQHVALKLLRLGLRDARSLARFSRERQLLARLSHPNIAALIDGGTADDGTPWVAMELVRGRSITEHAERAKLGLRQRVALFARLCDAVGHAHRNFIVHRDLKPANVLVTDAGEPKVLDFGIGKLLDDEFQGTATQAGAFTPSHASPEQWLGEPVTPASDVYALGVMLFELLSGELPQEPTPQRRGDWQAGAPGPLRRPSAVSRQISGDLESILLMALRKEAGRRYATATDLGADLRRWLDARPVAARPDSFAYRASKYVQRHPFGLAASAVVVALVIAFLVQTAVQSRRLEAERDRAVHEAAIAETTTGFLVELFHAPDPKMGQPGLTAADLLARARERIGGLEVEPLVKARLYHAIGLAYGNLGEFDHGLELLREGLRLREAAEGPDSLLVADSMNRLGDILREAGRLAEAEPYVAGALAIRARRNPGLDEDFADSHNNLGLLQLELGRYGEAARNLQSAIDMHRQMGNHNLVAIAQHNLALVRLAEGDPVAARVLVESAMSAKREGGRSGYSTYANTWALLARSLLDGGEAARALEEADASLALRRELLPDEHPHIAAGLSLRGDVLAALGRHEEALAMHDQAVAVATAVFGVDGWRTQRYASRRGVLLEALGEPGEAVDAHRALRDGARAAFGADSLHVAQAGLDLGRALLASGDVDAAGGELAGALEKLRASLPEGHASVREARVLLRRARGEAVTLPDEWTSDSRPRYQALRAVLER